MSRACSGFIQRMEENRIVGWVGCGKEGGVSLQLKILGLMWGELNVDPEECGFPETIDGMEGCWFEFRFEPMELLRNLPAGAEMIPVEICAGEERLCRDEHPVESWLKTLTYLDGIEREDLLPLAVDGRLSLLKDRIGTGERAKLAEGIRYYGLEKLMQDELRMLEGVEGGKDGASGEEDGFPGTPTSVPPVFEEEPDSEELFSRLKEYFRALSVVPEPEMDALLILLRRWVLDPGSPLNETERWALLQHAFWLAEQKLPSGDPVAKTIRKYRLEWLWSHRPEEFVEAYRKEMLESLYDGTLLLELPEESDGPPPSDDRVWIRSIEGYRRELIPLLETGNISTLVWELLSLVEGMAPERTRKVRYALARLQEDPETPESLWRSLRYGGVYDRIRIGQALKRKEVVREAEHYWIRNNLRYRYEPLKTEPWYRQALEIRAKRGEGRETFLEALSRAVAGESWREGERLNMMRLWLSESLLEHRAASEWDGFREEWCLLEPEAARYFDAADWLAGRTEQMDDALWNGFLNGMETEETDEKSLKTFLFQAMIFPYTIVLVYSCQAYRETRQKMLEQTWIQRLNSLGIPYRFVMGGGGEDRDDGRSLTLAVEDSYEALPKKSLAMFRWFVHHTGYERCLKIDDDCFLNVDAYFSDEALYRSSYYGRLIERQPGSTDRAWHQTKSVSAKARESLDLSPEPSYYADGSTGYALDRRAASALGKAAEDPVNAFLLSVSYMEDKLVGDLLGREGYRVETENFGSRILRRISSGYEATFWEYHPFPRWNNRVKVLHSETSDGIMRAWKNWRDPESIDPAMFYSDRPLEHAFSWGEGQQPIVEGLRVDEGAISRAQTLAIVCEPLSGSTESWVRGIEALETDHLLYLHRAESGHVLEQMLSRSDTSVFVTTQPLEFSRMGRSWMAALSTNFCGGRWVLCCGPDVSFGPETERVERQIDRAKREGLTRWENGRGMTLLLVRPHRDI